MTLDISAYSEPRLHHRMDRSVPFPCARPPSSTNTRAWPGVRIRQAACAKPVKQGHIRRIKVPLDAKHGTVRYGERGEIAGSQRGHSRLASLLLQDAMPMGRSHVVESLHRSFPLLRARRSDGCSLAALHHITPSLPSLPFLHPVLSVSSLIPLSLHPFTIPSPPLSHYNDSPRQ